MVFSLGCMCEESVRVIGERAIIDMSYIWWFFYAGDKQTSKWEFVF